MSIAELKKAVCDANLDLVFHGLVIYGAVVASFTVEDFSLHRLEQIGRQDIDARYEEFLGFTAHP